MALPTFIVFSSLEVCIVHFYNIHSGKRKAINNRNIFKRRKRTHLVKHTDVADIFYYSTCMWRYRVHQMISFLVQSWQTERRIARDRSSTRERNQISRFVNFRVLGNELISWILYYIQKKTKKQKNPKKGKCNEHFLLLVVPLIN